jgi:hypothetical protein
VGDAEATQGVERGEDPERGGRRLQRAGNSRRAAAAVSRATGWWRERIRERNEASKQVKPAGSPIP